VRGGCSEWSKEKRDAWENPVEMTTQAYLSKFEERPLIEVKVVVQSMLSKCLINKNTAAADNSTFSSEDPMVSDELWTRNTVAIKKDEIIIVGRLNGCI
jgi:hypothetical protein